MKEQILGKASVKEALLVAYYVFLAFTGIIPSQWLALIFLAIAICLLPYEQLIYMLPGALVYYSWFVVPFINISFYRVYTLMLIFKIFYIIKDKRFKIQNDVVFIFFPLFLHALISITFANARTGAFYILDLVMMVCLFSSGLIREEQMRRVLSLLVIACAMSVLSGVMLNNYLELSYELSGSWEKIMRFRGTFVDPNYCGFLYTFSILFCFCFKPFKKWQRVLLVLVLFLGIAMTISFSSYLSLAVMCLIYLILYKKIKMKTILWILLILAFLFFLFFYGVNNPDVAIIGDISYRIQSYMTDTSNAESRAKIWKIVYSEFENQSVLKQLFGMNAHAPVLNMNEDELIPAHNDYMEMLYNCGFLLTIVFYFGVFMRMVKHYRRFRYNNDEISGFVVLSKLTWLAFSFSLSMISERVFMPILFL